MGQNKERLFEVMGRLDKTFKPKMNEELEIVGGNDDSELPVDTGEEMPVDTGEENPIEEPEEEKSVEEKYEELKEKVEELYGMINGEEAEETPEEPAGEEEVEIETGEETPEEPAGEEEIDNELEEGK